MTHRVNRIPTSAAVVALSLASACTGGPTLPAPTEFNLDLQIDGFDFRTDGEADGFDAEDVNMCVTRAGVAYVVWRDDRENFQDVWLNRSDDGGLTWFAAPIRVKQGAGNASNVHMACQGDRIYVVWEDDRDGETGYQNIYLNYSDDRGDTWQPQDQALDNDPDGLAISQRPRIVLNQGRIHVVWYDQVEGAPDVYMATSINAGRRFQDPVCASCPREGDEDTQGVAWSGRPEVAVDAAGRIHVTWQDTRTGKPDIYYTRSADGGESFGPQVRIDKGDTRGANASFAPKIAAADDHVYIVWHDERGGLRRDVLMNYSGDAGVTWLEASVIVEEDLPGASDSINPSLWVEGSEALIAWQDARRGGYDVYLRTASAGAFGEEATETRLDRDEQGSGNSVSPVVVKRGDETAVIWQDFRVGGELYTDLYYAFRDETAEAPAWSASDFRVDSVTAGTSLTEDVNMDLLEGFVLTAWVDGRSGSRDVYFSRVALGASADSLSDYFAAIEAAQSDAE